MKSCVGPRLPRTVEGRLAKVVVLVDSVVVASTVAVVVLVLFGLFLSAFVRRLPAPAIPVPQPRGRKGAVVASLIGVLAVAVWYALDVIPAWQYRSHPPPTTYEIGEGNLGDVTLNIVFVLLFVGSGLVIGVVTLVLAIVAYVRKEWKSATLALAILAAAVAAYLVGLKIIG